MAGHQSGGRRKGIKITPKRVVKALVVLGGAKMILDSDVINLAKVHINDPKQVTNNPTKAVVEYASRIVPGALVITVGPKVVDKAAQLLSKGEPMIGRLANATIVKV